MPRNGSGVYSLPAGSAAVDGNTIEATTHNTPLADIETDMNTERPVVAGGTGAATASGARTNLEVAGLGDNNTLTGTLTVEGKITAEANLEVDGQFDVGDFSSSGASNGKRVANAAGNSDLQSSRSETASRSHVRFYNPNGEVGSISTNASATVYTTSSDERLKRDFRDFDAGAILDVMQIYEFAWLVDGSRGFGPKAQELHQVFPEAVTRGSDPDEPFVPWQWVGNPLVALLIREVQNLRRRLEDVENR